MNNIIVIVVFIALAGLLYFFLENRILKFKYDKFLIIKIAGILILIPYIILLFVAKFFPIIYKPLHNAPVIIIVAALITLFVFKTVKPSKNEN